jgi:aminopeptidase-like protein
LPEQPDLIPYRTTYYNRSWGFCLQHNRLAELRDPEYDVCIDATLEAGVLNYGELVLPGESDEEVLISTHVCHPSMANDNLSGLAVSVFLAEELSRRKRRRYTYRFVFVPGTIGAITWLARNAETTSRILGGLVVALVGAPGAFHYKASFDGVERIDRVARRTLRRLGFNYVDVPFSPYGYDERQYSSPGHRIPMGSLTRTPHGEFPEYHTSADDMDFVDGETLAESLHAHISIIEALESERILLNRFPYGEPQLGRRGLYEPVGGVRSSEGRMAMLWILNLADGRHSLDDIADRSGIDADAIADVAARLLAEGVVSEH